MPIIRLMRNLLALVILLILCGCGGGGSGSANSGGSGPAQMTQNPEVTLVRVEFTPASSTLASGLSTDLQLFAVFSNGIRVDVTSQASFSSTNPASVSLSGSRATAGLVGSSTIQGEFQTASTQIQIQVTAATLSSLRIDPPTATLAAGLTQRFRAYGTFSDSSTSEITSSVVWSVADDVAEFQSSPAGLLKALHAGDTQVTASLQGKLAHADLHVSAAQLTGLEISPNPLSLPVGIGQQFTATGVFSDGTHSPLTEDVSWSSSDTDTFLISDIPLSKGLGAGLKTGLVRLTVSSGAISAEAQITVTAAVLQTIAITPVDGSVPQGLDLEFHASGHFSDGQNRDISDQVIWASSQEEVASISNLPGSTGRAHGKTVGESEISAQLNGVSASTQLTVSQAVVQSIDVSGASPSLPNGLTRQFSALGHFSDGQSAPITDQVNWTSSDESVAVIGADGLATAKKPGNTQIRATLGAVTGQAELLVSEALLESLTIEPADSQLPKGLTSQLTATGHYSDGSPRNLTEEVTWSSSNESAATVSNAEGRHGQARALEIGETTVKAQLGAQEATTPLTVTSAVVKTILISPTRLSLAVGLGSNLKATAVFSDGKQSLVTGQVTWSSDQGQFASVNSAGRVLGVAQGQAEVQAQLGSVVGSVSVNVNTTVDSLEVVTAVKVLSGGTKGRYYALAHLADGSLRDATEDVDWSVLPPSIGSITQHVARSGEFTYASGDGQISAQLGALSAFKSVDFDGFGGGLVAIPQSLSLPVGGHAPVRLYAGMGERAVTTWASANPAVAVVQDGEVVAVGAGNTTLTAPGGDSVSAHRVRVHVPGSSLVALEVTAASPLAPGNFGGAHATVVTADGERLGVDNLADWSSSNPQVLLVEKGRMEARQGGAAVVTATFQGLSGSATQSVGGTLPSPDDARFVDNRVASGGDGSQGNPFNNLIEALVSVPRPGKLFVFSGDGSADGLLTADLPAQLEVRGQSTGWTERGVAAGDRPQLTGPFKMNNHVLFHGLAVSHVGDLATFDTVANATMDDVDMPAMTHILFNNPREDCRLLNSNIINFTGGTGDIPMRATISDDTYPGTASLEVANVTHSVGTFGGGFLTVGVNRANKLALNIHDNPVNLDRVLGVVGSACKHAEISVAKNTALDCYFDLPNLDESSKVEVVDNHFSSSVALWGRSSGGLFRIEGNTVASRIAKIEVHIQQFFLDYVATTVRIDGNRVTSTVAGGGIFAKTSADLTLIQNNVIQGPNASEDQLTLFTGITYVSRQLGVRDNQLNGRMRINVDAGELPTCLALTGNSGASLTISKTDGDLVVEGLSQLASLNQFGAISLAADLIEAAVDSCGIPH